MKCMKYILLFLFVTSLCASCKQTEDGGFAGLEDTVEVISDESKDLPVEIISASPSLDSVPMTANNSQTFAVQVNSGAGDVDYTFKLNGVVLQSSTSPFLNLESSGLVAGAHILELIATNSVSSDAHIFNLRKNTPPVISLDSNTSQTISCVSDSFDLDVTAADIDGDSINYDFYLNGSLGSSYLTTSAGLSSASVTFTPTCSLSGTNNVTIRATDSNGEYDEYTMAVTVSDPNIATIDSYSPSANPVYILSSLPQTFSVSASGKAPLLYEWRLDGIIIAGATSSIYTIGSSDITAGEHTLKLTVSDSDSSDSHTFNIVKNVAPVLSGNQPVDTSLKINYQILKTFSIEASDANNDALTFTWSLNNQTTTAISSTRVGNTATAILTPSELLLGSHVVKLTVSDGLEEDSFEWNVTINRLSTACNELTSGQVCTIVGPIGFNSGGSTQEFKSTRGKPAYFAKDNYDNLYVTDTSNSVVWYHNFSIVDRTVHGVEVPAYSAKIVLGNGVHGISPDGKSNTEFKLNSPRDLVYDSVTNSIFVVDYNNHRVVQLLEDGTARRALCYGSSGSSLSHNEYGPALSKGCYRPIGIALDSTNRKIYLSVYQHHNIKEFDISDPDYNNWTGGVLVGRKNSNGSIASGYDNNVSAGYTSSGARTQYPWAIELSSDGELLFWTEYHGDRVKVLNLSSSTKTLFNGALTIQPNKVVHVVGNGGGVTEGTYNSAKIDQPTGITLWESAGALQGLFITSYNRHVVNFVNNTAATITIGNEDVEPGYLRWVFGDRGGYYNGDSNPGNLTSIWNPLDLELMNNTVYVSTISTGMIRALDLSQADGDVSTPVASELINDFLTSDNPQDVRMMSPLHLASHPVRDEIYWGEEGSGKIRKVNVVTGDISQVLGYGSSAQDQDMQIPDDVYNYRIRGLSFHNDKLMYVENHRSWSVNRVCRVRLHNDSTVADDFFGVSIAGGIIGNIAGNYAKGCNNWEDPVGEQATAVRIKGPEAAISDGSNLYISAAYSHCILKVDETGIISQFSGDCDASGDVNGSIGSSSIRYNYPTGMAMDPEYAGNFFVVDRSTNNSSSYIKYVNQSNLDITIGGTVVYAGEVATVFTTAGFTSTVAAYGNWICYNSTYLYNYGDVRAKDNVNCIDRTNPLGSIGFRVGSSDSDTIKGGRQIANEYEGVDSMSIRLAKPMGLVFDNEGNLYISEVYGHSIKMVKKWF